MNCFTCSRKPRKKNDDELSSHVARADNDSMVVEGQPSDQLRGTQNHQGECSNPRVETEVRNPKQSFTMDEIFDLARDFLKEGESTADIDSTTSMFSVSGDITILQGCIKSMNKLVTITQLPLDRVQGDEEFMSKVNNLSLLNHPNIDSLIGYCREGRVLVHEYMPSGTLEDKFLIVRRQSWKTKIKIAVGIAKGLHYLICELNPPIIYTNLQSSNILLDRGYNPKLSLHGFENMCHTDGGITGGTPRENYFQAPEFLLHGVLTEKSNVYSFGLLLQEIILGHRTGVDLINDLPPLPPAIPIRGIGFPPSAIALAMKCMRGEAESRPSIVEVMRTISEFEPESYDGV